jgi:hypothetical protein
MINLHHKQLNESISVGRIIGHLQGREPGPTIIFTGGIHGNEPSGVFALYRLMEIFREKQHLLKGSVYALSGNLAALEKGKRFLHHDLNRLWTSSRVAEIERKSIEATDPETREMLDLYYTFASIREREKGPFYFMDLHTTSSESCPFLTVNDSLLNRKFTAQYPAPVILGLEEFLEGPVLSFVNEQGFVAFGFEGGQHDSEQALDNHVAFCVLSMVYTGIVDPTSIDFDRYYNQLSETLSPPHLFYEINSRYAIKEDESFKMKPGFLNFQRVKKDEVLAESNGKIVKANSEFRIFMPLYQPQGHDGFFGIKPVPRFFLWLSIFMRRIRIDRVLSLFPGVRWADKRRTALIVNRRVARFFTRDIFHLMGYRSKQLTKNHLIMRNREARARRDEYKDAPWM